MGFSQTVRGTGSQAPTVLSPMYLQFTCATLTNQIQLRALTVEKIARNQTSPTASCVPRPIRIGSIWHFQAASLPTPQPSCHITDNLQSTNTDAIEAWPGSSRHLTICTTARFFGSLPKRASEWREGRDRIIRVVHRFQGIRTSGLFDNVE